MNPGPSGKLRRRPRPSSSSTTSFPAVFSTRVTAPVNPVEASSTTRSRWAGTSRAAGRRSICTRVPQVLTVGCAKRARPQDGSMTDRPQEVRPTDARKLQILGAIVEDYVSTREPVGSKSLLDRHELGVSAATVRNDMSSLEEEGLIHQPHTSAGRVPTDKGYRAFVDHVATVKPLSAPERRAIQTLLEDAGDVEELLS